MIYLALLPLPAPAKVETEPTEQEQLFDFLPEGMRDEMRRHNPESVPESRKATPCPDCARLLAENGRLREALEEARSLLSQVLQAIADGEKEKQG